MATLSEEKQFQSWLSASEDRPITFVVVGKSGAGKSTLINTLLDLSGAKKAVVAYTGKSVTKRVEKFTAHRHGVDIHIIDTPGMYAIDRSKEDEDYMIAELHEITDGKADVILYCKSCLPDSKIDDLDLKIIQTLTKVFSDKIWKSTIFVLTFANVAPTLGGDTKQITATLAAQFNSALTLAKITSVHAKSVMDMEPNEEFDGIFAVPVAQSDTDKLPYADNWVAYLYTVVLKKCNPKAVPKLLQLRGLLNPLMKIAAATSAGAVTGAGAGAASGAVTGVGVGAVPGALIGGALGGGAAGFWKAKEILDIYRTNKKVREIVNKRKEMQEYKESLKKPQLPQGEP